MTRGRSAAALLWSQQVTIPEAGEVVRPAVTALAAPAPTHGLPAADARSEQAELNFKGESPTVH
jgi:hypothetical protein